MRDSDTNMDWLIGSLVALSIGSLTISAGIFIDALCKAWGF